MLSDKEFVETVVKGLVTKPDQVEVTRETDDMGVLIKLKVAKEDMGLVIGKAGAHINALRVLARVIGGQNKALINIKLFDPDRVDTV